MNEHDTDSIAAYFKFKIGDLVSIRAQRRMAAATEEVLYPQVGQIVERLIQQCYGGVQVLYSTRMNAGSWSHGLASIAQPQYFTEIELELAPDDPKQQPGPSTVNERPTAD